MRGGGSAEEVGSGRDGRGRQGGGVLGTTAWLRPWEGRGVLLLRRGGRCGIRCSPPTLSRHLNLVFKHPKDRLLVRFLVHPRQTRNATSKQPSLQKIERVQNSPSLGTPPVCTRAAPYEGREGCNAAFAPFGSRARGLWAGRGGWGEAGRSRAAAFRGQRRHRPWRLQRSTATTADPPAHRLFLSVSVRVVIVSGRGGGGRGRVGGGEWPRAAKTVAAAAMAVAAVAGAATRDKGAITGAYLPIPRSPYPHSAGDHGRGSGPRAAASASGPQLPPTAGPKRPPQTAIVEGNDGEGGDARDCVRQSGCQRGP